MILQFFTWYLIVQLITLAVLPLTATLFVNLADRGYAFAKSLGILLVGFALWLGTSYGLLRNESGGAWLALVIVGGLSVAVGRRRPGGPEGTPETGRQGEQSFIIHQPSSIPGRYILCIETLFLLAFALWAYVRAHDPAANHTEKPMDLMFMNSIWVSPTWPPHDAWLNGYAISYYYFGYWLLTTVGRLAGQPPEIAFSVGQACWFGLLLIGCVGVVYNLLRHAGQSLRMALIGGLLAAVAVGITGNLQGVMEWLYANGVDITGLAGWFAVNGFPENAVQTGKWYIGFDWWWWRSSRVVQDLDLLGQHIEVIDEFPMFSYILGDNHPHVLAMPFVLLVIGLAQNLFFGGQARRRPLATKVEPPALTLEDPVPAGVVGITAQATPSPLFSSIQWKKMGAEAAQLVQVAIPLAWPGLLVITIATGSLVFLNTWDFPPYWLLMVLAFFALLLRFLSVGRAAWGAGGLGVALVVATLVLYFPYFLTAQSQAGGFIPNLFNPTRFPQFLLMFGPALCGVLTLLGLNWPQISAARSKLLIGLAVVYGAPILFLLISIGLAFNTEAGRELLNRMPLPVGETRYWPLMAQRWSTQGLTFLVTGGLLALTVTTLWSLLAQEQDAAEDEAARRVRQSAIFALALAALGLLLVYAPEFVYLRDHFGARMNTIFKFYYQAWLLFGLSSAYAIVMAFQGQGAGSRGVGEWGSGRGGADSQFATRNSHLATRILATLAFLLIGAGLIYPLAATYSKTGGFAAPEPTFDATAYITAENPAVAAAIAWVRANTASDAVIAEARGASYRANYSRISATTGRPTLLGWEGHESQWRGTAYLEMAGGRADALEWIYRSGSAEQVAQVLATWEIDYVFVGPTERAEYQITPMTEERLLRSMDLVFEQGDVRIYQRRSR